MIWRKFVEHARSVFRSMRSMAASAPAIETMIVMRAIRRHQVVEPCFDTLVLGGGFLRRGSATSARSICRRSSVAQSMGYVLSVGPELDFPRAALPVVSPAVEELCQRAQLAQAAGLAPDAISEARKGAYLSGNIRSAGTRVPNAGPASSTPNAIDLAAELSAEFRAPLNAHTSFKVDH